MFAGTRDMFEATIGFVKLDPRGAFFAVAGSLNSCFARSRHRLSPRAIATRVLDDAGPEVHSASRGGFAR
jgi:hypothetical protein